jgi:hypothetical protein
MESNLLGNQPLRTKARFATMWLYHVVAIYIKDEKPRLLSIKTVPGTKRRSTDFSVWSFQVVKNPANE